MSTPSSFTIPTKSGFQHGGKICRVSRVVDGVVFGKVLISKGLTANDYAKVYIPVAKLQAAGVRF